MPMPWCSTLVDDSGNHVAGKEKYGDCGTECPIKVLTIYVTNE